MAGMSIDLDTDFEEINVREAIEKSAKVVYQEIKNAYAREDMPNGTNTLKNDIIMGRPDTDKSISIWVRKRSVHHALWREYGTVNQPPRPIFTGAVNSAEKKAYRIQEEILHGK